MENQGDEIQCKITFVGESNVGKTSLIQQYVNKVFDPNYLTTIGGDQLMKPIVINDKKINLNIWDTAGQERFRSINKIFLKNSKIVILVYDITNKKSFDKIVEFWYPKVIEILGNDIIIGLAANKSDLYELETINIEQVKQFAQEKNLIFKETSAMNHDCVESFFQELIQLFFEKNKDNICDNTVNLSSISSQDNNKKNRCCSN